VLKAENICCDAIQHGSESQLMAYKSSEQRIMIKQQHKRYITTHAFNRWLLIWCRKEWLGQVAIPPRCCLAVSLQWPKRSKATRHIRVISTFNCSAQGTLQLENIRARVCLTRSLTTTCSMQPGISSCGTGSHGLEDARDPFNPY